MKSGASQDQCNGCFAPCQEMQSRAHAAVNRNRIWSREVGFPAGYAVFTGYVRDPFGGLRVGRSIVKVARHFQHFQTAARATDRPKTRSIVADLQRYILASLPGGTYSEELSGIGILSGVGYRFWA